MESKSTRNERAMTISIVRDGAEIGEWPEDQVRAYIGNGQLVSSDLYWCEGMTDWKPLRTLVKPPLPTSPQVLEPLRAVAVAPRVQTGSAALPIMPPAAEMLPPNLPALPATRSETSELIQREANNLRIGHTKIPIWIEVFGYLVLLFALSMLSDVVDDIRNNFHPSTAGMLGGTMAYKRAFLTDKPEVFRWRNSRAPSTHKSRRGH
jgi:hypothetical protein